MELVATAFEQDFDLEFVKETLITQDIGTYIQTSIAYKDQVRGKYLRLCEIYLVESVFKISLDYASVAIYTYKCEGLLYDVYMSITNFNHNFLGY